MATQPHPSAPHAGEHPHETEHPKQADNGGASTAALAAIDAQLIKAGYGSKPGSGIYNLIETLAVQTYGIPRAIDPAEVVPTDQQAADAKAAKEKA